MTLDLQQNMTKNKLFRYVTNFIESYEIKSPLDVCTTNIEISDAYTFITKCAEAIGAFEKENT